MMLWWNEKDAFALTDSVATDSTQPMVLLLVPTRDGTTSDTLKQKVLRADAVVRLHGIGTLRPRRRLIHEATSVVLDSLNVSVEFSKSPL